MKPPPFKYHACRTIDEAVGILDSDPDGSKVLAGGQSLVPVLNLRLAAPDNLVDINSIESLDHIRVQPDHVAIGAGTRQYVVERSDQLHSVLPVVREALSHVGHSQIRNRGTVVGSICHADPAAEMPAVFLTVGGEVTAHSAAGTRTIGSDDFFESYLTTALEPNEIVTQVKFDIPSGRTGWYFEEVARRHGDFAILGVVALVSLEGDTVSRARITIFGGGATPLRMTAAEQLITGAKASDIGGDLLERAAIEASAAVRPTDDIHASADYRRHVAGLLTRRAVTRSLERAGSPA
ncbi:FAD binding domain-containing protein [Streptomyces carpinensis]|uniref:Xanthine dehydrogenase family protein subunit M n=1 Tax=Streptomyces carpinensis TaxID=66369 RepID=A0ABV1VUB9_9ACTN|nr:xanthine dehydrogenase family protein subunit M [Streptomyces carpinensis]